MATGSPNARSGSPLTAEATCQGCGLTSIVPFDRFHDKEYISWLKSSLCLQYTKEGLEKFVDNTSEEFHQLVKKDILAASTCSQQCVLSDKFTCPNNICDKLKKTLVCYSKRGRLQWKNTTLKDMVASHHSVSKLFMPSMCNNYTDPMEADSTAVLSLMEDSKHFRSHLRNTDAVNHVRESRNAIMHSGTMRIKEQQLSQHTSNFIALLEDPESLAMNPECQEAITKIKEEKHVARNEWRLARVQEVSTDNDSLVRKLSDNSVEIDLVGMESEVMDQQYKHNHDKIKCWEQIVDAPGSTEGEMEKAKCRLKKVGEQQEKVKMLMNIYDVDDTKVDRIVRTANRLYEKVERRLKDVNMKGKDEKIEQLQQLLSEEQVKHNKDTTKLNFDIGMLRKQLDIERLRTSTLENEPTVSATNDEKYKDDLMKQSNVAEGISPTPRRSGNKEGNEGMLPDRRGGRKPPTRLQKEATEFEQNVDSLKSSDRKDVRETEDIEGEKFTDKVPAESVTVEQKVDSQKTIDRRDVVVDRRIQEYWQSCDIDAPNSDMIEEIQNRIISATPQSSKLVLSDIYIKKPQWRRDIADGYLDMARVTSIHVQCPVDLTTQQRLKETQCLQKLVLYKSGMNVESIHEMILENKDTLRTLGLYGEMDKPLDLSSLGEKLTEIFNGCQLSSLGLGRVKLSHSQYQILSRHFSTTDNLRQVTLRGTSCSTHEDSGECLSELDLNNHKQMKEVELFLLPVIKVMFMADQLQLCEINLPGNTAAQISALTCLQTARNLQLFGCGALEDFTSVRELAVVLPQLNALQKISLRQIDFSRLREIRLSAAMEKLESVELWFCTITDEAVKCLVDSLPTHKVEIWLRGVTIRGRENFLQKIRDSPNIEVTVDRNVMYENGGWEVERFEFYNNK